VVLVPILGLTLRFAIKPFFDTWAEIQRGRATGTDGIDERRLDLLEAELQQVQNALRSVTDAQDFQRQLTSPVPANESEQRRATQPSEPPLR
jgi:hypothetical protein